MRATCWECCKPLWKSSSWMLTSPYIRHEQNGEKGIYFCNEACFVRWCMEHMHYYFEEMKRHGADVRKK